MAPPPNPQRRKAQVQPGPASGTKRRKKTTSKPQNAKPIPDTPPLENPGPFAWKASPDTADDFKRLEMKEEAVIQGLRHADEILSILTPLLHQANGLEKGAATGFKGGASSGQPVQEGENSGLANLPVNTPPDSTDAGSRPQGGSTAGPKDYSAGVPNDDSAHGPKNTKLDPADGRTNNETNSPAGPVNTELKDWVAHLDEIKQRINEFRVYLGFMGVTGAGKTSAINTIIGFRDLLPSSNETAATAVPTLIAYNSDPNPDAAFKAEVTFRTETDIRQMLDHYLDALALLEEARDIKPEDDDNANDESQETRNMKNKARVDRENDRAKAIQIVEGDNQDLLDMVSAVFGLDEASLKKETSVTLKAKYPDVFSLLGQTKTIVGSSPEVFAENIKPYLDSVMAVHGQSGNEFAAWPLINEVKVYVPSPVLKSGIVLVDLPGLSDATESRGSVARDYRSKLTVTAIVAPITRACSEQTAVNLMSEHQRLNLQMDGKLNKSGYCLVLSKMDDIDVETQLKQHHQDAVSDAIPQEDRAMIKKLDQEFRELEKDKAANKRRVREIRNTLNKLQAEQEKLHAERDNRKKNKEAERGKHKKSKEANDDASHAAEAIQKCKSDMQHEIAERISLDRKELTNRKRTKFLKGRLLHWCIVGRNKFSNKTIQQDFFRRQKRLEMESQKTQGNPQDTTVNIFPISSAAYWQVTEDSEPPVGFPTAQYTGIPALQNWLQYSAVQEREDHLDGVVEMLHGLYNSMDAWSSNSSVSDGLTKTFVEEEVLHRPLDQFQKGMATVFNKLARQIKGLNPLKNKDSTNPNCKERCVAAVKRWSFKEPDNLLIKTKTHWCTYGACVSRDGGMFKSTSQGRQRYYWIESLCNVFYEGIAKEWNSALNERLPELQEPINAEIDSLWEKLMKQLDKRIAVAVPQRKPILDRDRHKFDHVRVQMKGLVKYQFKMLRTGASQAHRQIIPYVRNKWKPTFKRAKQEKGTGKFDRQQMILVKFATLRGANMFKESTDRIDELLRDQLGRASKQFTSITKAACNQLRHLMMALLDLDDTVKSTVVVMAARGAGGQRVSTVVTKEATQLATRAVVLKWGAQWRMGTEKDTGIEVADVEIPDVYYEEEDVEGEGDFDMQDEGGYEDYEGFMEGEEEDYASYMAL